MGHEDRGVGEPEPAQLPGGFAQGDDYRMGGRVVGRLDPIVAAGDHRLIDHCHGRDRALASASASFASASASPMKSW